jgi:beta-lactam-binding protein with PASTA domain
VRPPIPPRRRVPAPGPGWHRELPRRVKRYFDEQALLKWVLATALLCFVGGYLLITLLFFPGFGRSAIVTVPDLTERTAGQADRALDRIGLTMQRGGTLPNARVRQGRVLMQTPLPGEEVARGATVRIVLSAGPEVRQVPAVTGLSRTILGLLPATGQRAAVGSVVTIQVSAGPPFLRVPQVVGLASGDARAQLQAVGFEVGRLGYDPASAEPAGTVVAQAPAAGDSLRQGSGVRLTLAGENPNPPAVVVDSVVTDSAAVAEEPPVEGEEPAEPKPEPEPEPEPAKEPEKP